MPGTVSFAKQPSSALIHVRLLPWRPKPRRGRRPKDHNADGADLADIAFGAADDVAGLVIGVTIAVLIYGLTPAIFLVLAILLFPVEVFVVVVLGAALLIVRFAGIVPWTVVLTSPDGSAATERYRNVRTAMTRTRSVNPDGRVPVRLSLT